MFYTGKYRKIGSSWGINIPRELAEMVGIKPGEQVLVYTATNSVGMPCLALEPVSQYERELSIRGGESQRKKRERAPAKV